MKKAYFFVSLMVFSLVLAALCLSAATGAGNGAQTNAGQQMQVRLDGVQLQTREQVKERVNEIREANRQRSQEMIKEIQGKSEAFQKVYQNQNQVRLAVHALLQMENLTGGIGPQISQIARDFNNSVQSTIRAEERIQTRSSFSRFFAGGDKKAAEEIELQTARNEERIRQLNQLREQCNCTEEVRAMMQEQIQQMQQEKNRLQELVQEEKKSKGLFGWIWK